jgi:hypothetical protein
MTEDGRLQLSFVNRRSSQARERGMSSLAGKVAVVTGGRAASGADCARISPHEGDGQLQFAATGARSRRTLDCDQIIVINWKSAYNCSKVALTPMMHQQFGHHQRVRNFGASSVADTQRMDIAPGKLSAAMLNTTSSLN